MSGKGYKPEQAIALLREADILVGQELTVPEALHPVAQTSGYR